MVRARTPGGAAECPGCGAGSARIHGVHERRLADLPVDGRSVMVRVRVRRLYCPTQGCQRTFREQVPGVVERYQRRATRLTGHVRAAVRELAGRAAVRTLGRWSVRLSRQTSVRVVLGIPLQTQKVPRVLSVDDFALLRRRRSTSPTTDPSRLNQPATTESGPEPLIGHSRGMLLRHELRPTAPRRPRDCGYLQSPHVVPARVAAAVVIVLLLDRLWSPPQCKRICGRQVDNETLFIGW
ncbi:transposase family protein [Nocardia carnea]|uniref:transposase family protein n=1 Tax=Nocardia carnea TaxID=37328 RepID=UPI003D76F26B